MRAFFQSEFKTLKLKTGLNQFENLCALEDAENQISLLLDMLVRVCDDFQYIPEPDKKRIIQEGIYRDNDFTQLVPRIVWKWLNAQSAKYYKEAAHIKEPDPEPVAYENLNPELKAKVDNLLKELSEPSKFSVPSVTQHDMDVIKALDELSKGEATETHKTDYEHRAKLEREHALKIEYGRLFTESDNLGGYRVKEGSPSFHEWEKQQTI